MLETENKHVLTVKLTLDQNHSRQSCFGGHICSSSPADATEINIKHHLFVCLFIHKMKTCLH